MPDTPDPRALLATVRAALAAWAKVKAEIVADDTVRAVRRELLDEALVNHFMAAPAWLAQLADALEEIERAMREEACPAENSDAGTDAIYVCLNDDGDPIIEADSLADAIRGMARCWGSEHSRAERERRRAEQAEDAKEAAERARDDWKHTAEMLSEDLSKLGAIHEGIRAKLCDAYSAAVREAAVARAQSAAILARVMSRCGDERIALSIKQAIADMPLPARPGRGEDRPCD